MQSDVRGSSLLTPADAAQLARVSVKTIYRAIGSGALVASRLGAVYRITPENYTRWVDGSATGMGRTSSGPNRGSVGQVAAHRMRFARSSGE